MARKSAKKSSLSPLGDRVLVRLLSEEEQESKTESGIIIPATVEKDKKTTEGEVTAVGEGRYEDGKLVKLAVRPGDRILFESWSGTKIEVDGVEHTILREDSILAVIK